MYTVIQPYPKISAPIFGRSQNHSEPLLCGHSSHRRPVPYHLSDRPAQRDEAAHNARRAERPSWCPLSVFLGSILTFANPVDRRLNDRRSIRLPRSAPVPWGLHSGSTPGGFTVTLAFEVARQYSNRKISHPWRSISALDFGLDSARSTVYCISFIRRARRAEHLKHQDLRSRTSADNYV